MSKLTIKTKWTLVVVLLLLFTIIFSGYFILNGVMENQEEYYIDYLMSKSKDVNLFLRESYISGDYDNLRDYYEMENDQIVNSLRRIIKLPLELLDEEGELISSKDKIRGLNSPGIIDRAIEGNPIFEKTGSSIVYLAPVYDYNEQIGICRIQYSTDREDDLYAAMKSLFIKVGLISTGFISVLGIIYFSRLANIILGLKENVQAIGQGNYEELQVFETGDELEELSLGIIEMSHMIESNMEKIQEEKEKLETMINRLKKLEAKQEEFIGNITHEFKTPLTILKIQVDMIKLYKDDGELLSKTNEIMNEELVRLNNMVENILYLSKIKHYDYEFNKELINTKNILETIIFRLNNKAEEYNVRLEYDLAEEVLFADRDSFIRIFINLIDNAIKYNYDGGLVSIFTYRKDDKVIFKIENTGGHIEDKDIKKIFQPFYTVDSSRNKKISGTGLGLPLAKNLIEKQNGRIEFKSTRDLNICTVVFTNDNRN